MLTLRRRLWSLLLTTLLVPALGGCVVSKYTFESQPAGQRSLTVWTYVNDPVLTPALNAIWTKEHPDVPVHLAFIDLNELPPKEVAAAGTKSGPDVIIGNPVVDYPLAESGHAYADITDQVERSGILRVYPKSALWQTDGRVHALQWRFNNLALWYNATLLKKYHLTPPRTVAEMEHDMQVAHDASHGAIHGLAMSADASVQSAWQMMTWLLGNGVNYCSLDSPKTAQTLAMLTSWHNKGWTGPGMAAEGMEDVFLDFLRGDYLFAEGGSWEVGTVKQNPPAFQVGTTAIPAGSAGSFTSFAGESVAVGNYSKHKDLAWDYVKAVYLSEAGQIATFTDSGGLPPRVDTRQVKQVQQVKLSQPFLAELAPNRLKPWPDNTQTLDAQNDVGTAWSDLMAGSTTPQQAAQTMRDKVHADFEEGTGGC